MQAYQIWIAFLTTLGTNAIVLSGGIAYFYWIDAQPEASFVSRFAPWLRGVAMVLLSLYLYAEAWMNTYIAPNAFGLHWAFLNMLIVSIFLLLARFAWWWGVAIEVLLIWTYALGGAQAWTPRLLLLMLGVAVILAAVHIVHRRLFTSRLFGYLLLGLFGANMMALIIAMGPENIDGYFWLRQISSLVVLSMVGFEYARSMEKMLTRSQFMANSARTDGLSHLLNFATFDHDLRQAFTGFQRKQEPYAVFELDLDYFKKINDTYGHLAGNTVLVSVASTLAANARTLPDYAPVYRLGGEEFAVIVYGEHDDERDWAIAKQFKDSVDQIRFPEINPELRLTVSIGQARCEAAHYSYNDTYKEADRSLYLSKQRGRNCITLAGDTIM